MSELRVFEFLGSVLVLFHTQKATVAADFTLIN